MARVRRLTAVLVTLGTLLSLSACGTSASLVVGTYKATIVTTAVSFQAQFFSGGTSAFSLVITADGHFVMESRYHPLVTWKGTWSESNDHVTLKTSKIEFNAVEKGDNLQQGRIEYLSRHEPTGYEQSWSAVRTG
jgi:hypothetical protein